MPDSQGRPGLTGTKLQPDNPLDYPDGGHAMTHQTATETELRDSKRKMVSGTYLRNAWYVAAWSDDLVDGQLLSRTIMQEPIVLYRKSDGNVLNPHGAKNIPSRARVRSFPVTEKHKAIWIWMGERSPDHSKVPDFSVLDNVPEMHTTKRDKMTIRANYELIVDNLLDLSHTCYLHDGILGNSDTVESDITVEQEGEDVVVGRHAGGVTAPGLFAALWPSRPDRVDKFTSMRWMAPSTMRLLTGICMPGAVPESGTGYHAIHMLTPETDRTTHYFFTAVRFNVQTTDDTLNRQIQDNISTTRRFAFEEQDAPVIEAQQEIIDSALTPVDPVILAIDVGPVRYKRILQKMIEQEQPQ
jgi:phenylpropionate dioxygenase-like ring-hydroxylating dioxygenase large terminal subunit